MKNFLLTTVLMLLGTLVFSQERIAVFPFEDMDNILTKSESIFFYRQFSNEFTNKNAGRFTIVPRQDVEKLFNAEEKFQISDLSAKAKTAETQRVLNGTRILSGIIGKVGTRITISISLYTFPDLGQLPGGVDKRVANKDELFDKIPELVQEMRNAIAGVSVNTAIPANFVRVEGGTFQMGSNNGDSDEKPVHTVTVNSFYMSKYEVTEQDWQDVMGKRNIVNGVNFPIQVTWYDAIDYCNRRSIKEGLIPAYRGEGDNITCDWSSNGYRLPTEAEWEYAAKGGNKDYIIFRYSGSNNPSTVAWYYENGQKKYSPVGTKSPNSLGIYDMSGNVTEWCWDWYGEYKNTSQNNPHGPDSPVNYDWGPYIARVGRGGSAGDSIREITTTARLQAWTYHKSYGFRVVLSIPLTNTR